MMGMSGNSFLKKPNLRYSGLNELPHSYILIETVLQRTERILLFRICSSMLTEMQCASSTTSRLSSFCATTILMLFRNLGLKRDSGVMYNSLAYGCPEARSFSICHLADVDQPMPYGTAHDELTPMIGPTSCLSGKVASELRICTLTPYPLSAST